MWPASRDLGSRSISLRLRPINKGDLVVSRLFMCDWVITPCWQECTELDSVQRRKKHAGNSNFKGDYKGNGCCRCHETQNGRHWLKRQQGERTVLRQTNSRHGPDTSPPHQAATIKPDHQSDGACVCVCVCACVCVCVRVCVLLLFLSHPLLACFFSVCCIANWLHSFGSWGRKPPLCLSNQWVLRWTLLMAQRLHSQTKKKKKQKKKEKPHVPLPLQFVQYWRKNAASAKLAGNKKKCMHAKHHGEFNDSVNRSPCLPRDCHATCACFLWCCTVAGQSPSKETVNHHFSLTPCLTNNQKKSKPSQASKDDRSCSHQHLCCAPRPLLAPCRSPSAHLCRGQCVMCVWCV